MIYVGIDVAKDKHDCCILDANAEKLFPTFTIPNNQTGFGELYERLNSVTEDNSEIKVGLEATGHYSLNLLGSLIDKGLTTFVINPLHTNLYRKGQSLRKTKTDKVDANSIAMMLITDKTLKPYSDTSYHNEDLKSLTRYRFDKVQERTKLESFVARLVNILFPELEHLVPTLHMASVYALLKELPGASHVAACHLTRLKNLLETASWSRYGREKAIELRNAAQASIGSVMPSKSMELRHTISLIEVLTDEIDEIGDFSRFTDADKILAYAGMSPSTYQSGQLQSSHSHMEKRGSRYLRYALFNATKFVCKWDERFAVYLAKKIREGKHYNIAVSHAAKKLMRTIYRMELTGEPYRK